MYDEITKRLYSNLLKRHPGRRIPQELQFTLMDVRKAMAQAFKAGLIAREIKNVPDIKYTYDARRTLPPELEHRGPLTWLQNGKGKYKFRRTKRPNLIQLPSALQRKPRTRQIIDQTPKSILPLLGNDEQASFTRVRNANLIQQFLGFSAWQIQGHKRTTVSYGQIELDEVHAGLERKTITVVPISGKGGQDMLSWSQALNLNTYGREKMAEGVAVRSLGLWVDPSKCVWLVEFSSEIEIDKIRIVKAHRYEFV